MDKFLEKFADRFIGFFTRSVAPSSIFFVLLFFNDKFFNCSEIYFQFISFIKELQSIDNILLYVILTILFLSYGYVNQIFSQILDNLIKENYDDNDDKYNNLRDKVKIKFTTEFDDWKEDAVIFLNDYNLYQILSRDKSIAPNSNYVDEVKTIHTLFIAITLNLFFINIYTILINIIFILFLIFSKKVQHFINIPGKSRYKARNKRLYINYLLKENNSNQ